MSALFPCIFLLIVSASEITVAGTDAPFRAFNTFVEVGFNGLNIVFLCPSTLLNGVSVVLTSLTDALASVCWVVKIGIVIFEFDGLYSAPKPVQAMISVSKLVTFLFCLVSVFDAIILNFN